MAVTDWFGAGEALALRGAGVTLRAPRMSDFATWQTLRSESRAFLQPWEPTWPADDLTRAAFRRRLSLYARDRDLGTGYAFFVFDEASALTGGINLRNITRGVAQSGAIGYWAGERFARRGHTLAAVQALTRFAFRDLELHRIEASCCTDNAPSRALLLKAGFEEEGIARSYLKINGNWRDHRLFGLIGDGSDTAT